MLGTPVPVRTLKLTNIEQGPYLDGRILGSSWCCWHSFIHKNRLEASGRIGPPCCWMYGVGVHHTWIISKQRNQHQWGQNRGFWNVRVNTLQNLMQIYICQSRVFFSRCRMNYLQTSFSKSEPTPKAVMKMWFLFSTAQRSRTFRNNERNQCQQTKVEEVSTL